MGKTLGRKVTTKKRGTSTSSFGTSARIGHDSSKFYNTKLYDGLAIFQGDGQGDNEFPPGLVNSVVLGSSESMNQIPDRSAHLMITSPPYNVSKEYDGNLSLQQYLDLITRVFTET